jgi:F0F1-type ATP synthase membrane subunit b/b'
LKARGDLQYKNIGTAKTELNLIAEAFEKAKTSTTDENKKAIEELQGILKKALSEIDADLPAAINRIDLLWYEMGKLPGKV